MPPVTTGMVLVFALVAVALALFVTELVSPDMTAIAVLVALAVMEPYTGVPAEDAISGFASPATVTILAMFILSEGVQRTGVVERLGVYLGRVTHGDEQRILGATVGTTGVSAGFVNNTPVVAVFIPMITDLAERADVSPSKLLMPLSFAAMLGGVLTLVGTATNLLASSIAADLGVAGAPFGMFQFTPLGVVVLAVGGAYLLFVGPRLLPERIPPAGVRGKYDLEDHLARVTVTERSPLVGAPARDAFADLDLEIDVLQLERNGDTYLAAATDRLVEPDDVLVLRGSQGALDRVARGYGLRLRARPPTGDGERDDAQVPTFVEVNLRSGSRLVGRTIGDAKLERRFDTSVLAVRRGDTLLRTGLADVVLSAGDTLLLQAPRYAVEFLEENGDVTVTHRESELMAPSPEVEPLPPLSSKAPVALAILAAVVGLAAAGMVPIVISALGGVVAMVVTGCVTPTDAYDAVSWDVIFLLAGILPLGIAMQRTGGAEFIASLLVDGAAVLPVVVVVWLFYLLTGLLANVITPVASVVLMLPVAVDTATRVGAEGLPFVFAVMFAASTAFMTPVGYQTNLMVYGPGGYRFTDYLKVGAPLQLLLGVVTTLGIVVLWPP